MIDFKTISGLSLDQLRRPPTLSATMRLFVGEPCFYCKRPMSANVHALRPTRDHYNRYKFDRKHVVICCFECNQRKGTMAGEEFVRRMQAGEFVVSPVESYGKGEV